jgi:hypothetical protein
LRVTGSATTGASVAAAGASVAAGAQAAKAMAATAVLNRVQNFFNISSPYFFLICAVHFAGDFSYYLVIERAMCNFVLT